MKLRIGAGRTLTLTATGEHYLIALLLRDIEHGDPGPFEHGLLRLAAGEHFTCPNCRKTSFNENDIKNRYCGACHTFH